ncbi:uncharacterized protein LOC109195704 isoform X3 [Oreochromis niloticus]|nr:uncharacterized protein LOC109195704 isoform X3 [Oreochromis niloticus]
MVARALSLNLTAGMRLVGTQARGCPPLFMARRSVSALIIIKPSLLQIKARGLRLAVPLSRQAEEELTGLCRSLLRKMPGISAPYLSPHNEVKLPPDKMRSSNQPAD